MGRNKWCFDLRNVICMTKDCPYMRECVQSVYEQRMSAFEGVFSRCDPTVATLKQIKRVVRRNSRLRKEKA